MNSKLCSSKFLLSKWLRLRQCRCIKFFLALEPVNSLNSLNSLLLGAFIAWLVITLLDSIYHGELGIYWHWHFYKCDFISW